MAMLWTIVIVAAIIIEAITVDLVSIWFSIGAIIALIAYLLNFSTAVQLSLFIIISLICIVLARPLAKKYLRTNIVQTNLDKVIGKHALVTQTITYDNKGEVKVMGQYWFATSYNNEIVEEGCYAEILAIEGNHLIVKKIKEKEI